MKKQSSGDKVQKGVTVKELTIEGKTYADVIDILCQADKDTTDIKITVTNKDVIFS